MYIIENLNFPMLHVTKNYSSSPKHGMCIRKLKAQESKSEALDNSALVGLRSGNPQSA